MVFALAGLNEPLMFDKESLQPFPGILSCVVVPPNFTNPLSYVIVGLVRPISLTEALLSKEWLF